MTKAQTQAVVSMYADMALLMQRISRGDGKEQYPTEILFLAGQIRGMGHVEDGVICTTVFSALRFPSAAKIEPELIEAVLCRKTGLQAVLDMPSNSGTL